MSDQDERIVNMRINNKQFLKGTGESLRALDNLNKGIDNASKGRGMQSLGGSVDTVKTKFSAMQIAGVTAIANIANRAVNAGIAMAKSMTIAPIMDGFREYEKLLKSTQTIKANTAAPIKAVTAALDELNTYSDQTIYNFGQMADNVGKFTAAGVKLDVATTAIKGLANTAALAGSDTNQLNTAMYQMSQALATGTIKLMDWNSLVNAGMGGKNVQNALKATAMTFDDTSAAMTLAIKKGGSFRDSLQYGWLESKVFTKTMKVMAGTTKLSTLFTEDATTATQKLTEMGYDKLAISSIKAGKTVAYSVKQLQKMGYSKKAAIELNRLSQASIESATKIKTFSQLMDVVKESLGSGWAGIWRKVFGDLEQSTELWTKVGDAVTGAIGRMFTSITNILTVWQQGKGFENFWGGIGNIFQTLGNLLRPFVVLIKSMLPSVNSAGKGLAGLTEAFYNITLKLREASEATGILSPILAFLGGVFKVLGGAIVMIVRYFADLVVLVWPLVEALGRLGSAAGDMVERFLAWSNLESRMRSLFETLLEGRRAVLEPLVAAASKVADALSALFSGNVEGFKKNLAGAFDALGPLGDHLQAVGAKVTAFFDSLSNSGGFIGALFEKLKGLGSTLSSIGSSLSTAFSSASSAVAPLASLSGASDKASASGEKFVSIWDKVATFFSVAGTFIAGAASGLATIFGGLFDKIWTFVKGLDALDVANAISLIFSGAVIITAMKFMRSFTGVLEAFKGIGTGAMDVLNQTTSTLKTMQTGVRAKALMNIAIAIALLSASLWVLSKIPAKDLAKGLFVVATMINLMTVAVSSLTQGKAALSLPLVTTALIGLAGALVILSAAVLAFGKMDNEVLIKGGIAIGVAIAAMTASLFLLGKVGPQALAAGAALVLMSNALVIMAEALTAFAGVVLLYEKIDFDKLKSGLFKMVLTLVALGAGMALLAVQGALLLIASAALLILNVALLGLLGTIAAYSAMDWGDLLSGLAKMGVALIALGVAGAVSAIGIMALGLAMAVLGVGLLAAGIGIGMIGAGLALIAASGAASMAILVAGFESLLLLIPMMGVQLVAALKLILAALAKASPSIVDSLVKIGTELLRGLGELLEPLGDFLIKLIDKLLDVLEESIPRIAEAISNLIVSLIDELSNHEQELLDAGTELLVTLMEGIADSTEELANAAGQMILDILTAINEAIDTYAAPIGEQGRQIGLNLIQGLVQGLVPEPIRTAFSDLVDNVVNWFKGLLGINSPSTVFMGFGSDIVRGLINGITNFIGNARTTIVNLASKIKDGFANKLSEIKSKVTDILSEVRTTLVTKFTEGFNAAKDAVANGITTIKNALSSLPGAIRNKATEVFNAAKKMGSRIIDGIKSGISAVGGLVTNIASAIKRAVNNALGLPKHIGIKAGKGKFKIDTGVTIPAFAKGTDNFGGGLALVGEAGPELATLGRGSAVITNKNLMAFIKSVSQLVSKLSGSNMGASPGGQINYVVSADFKGDPRQNGIVFAANLAAGLVQGLKSSQQSVNASTAAMGLGVLNTFASTLEINSPSRAMARQGVYTAQGFANGLRASIPLIQQAAKTLALTATDTVSRTIKKSQLDLEAKSATADAYAAAAAAARRKSKQKGISKKEKKRLEREAKALDAKAKQAQAQANAQQAKVDAENAAEDRRNQFNSSDDAGKADMRREDSANAAKAASAARERAQRLKKEADLTRKYDKKRAAQLDKQAKQALDASKVYAQQSVNYAKEANAFAAKAEAAADAAEETQAQIEQISAEDVLKAQSVFDQYTKALQDVQLEAQATAPAPIEITQNNYSPEALSPSEIYRQTKNLTSLMERKLQPTG